MPRREWQAARTCPLELGTAGRGLGNDVQVYALTLNAGNDGQLVLTGTADDLRAFAHRLVDVLPRD